MNNKSAAAPLLLRRSLHDELVDRLRAMIVDGEIRPGEKVPEVALSEHFGVSRTPLREALKTLAAEGLVSILPHRGAIVSVITAAEIAELFPIIGALEALAGELACEAMSTDEIAALRRLHDDMMAQFRDSDEVAYRRTNWAFHEMLVRCARNTSLGDLYKGLLRRIHAARFILSKTEEDWRRAIADHKDIIIAVEERDGTRLAELLRRHLSVTAAEATLNALSRDRT